LREVIGSKFSGWIRLGRPRVFQPSLSRETVYGLGEIFQGRRRRLSLWRATDTLWGLDRIFNMTAPEARRIVAALPDGFHEFLFHPRTRHCPDSLCLLELKSSPSA